MVLVYVVEIPKGKIPFVSRQRSVRVAVIADAYVTFTFDLTNNESSCTGVMLPSV